MQHFNLATVSLHQALNLSDYVAQGDTDEYQVLNFNFTDQLQYTCNLGFHWVHLILTVLTDLFQSNEYESSPTGDLRYGHAFDSRCTKHSPAVSPNASSPALTELARTPDCGCQVRLLSLFVIALC